MILGGCPEQDWSDVMEPIYVADNEYVDAFAIAWLLQEDHLFFNDDEIGWNGKHHTIKGMQLNAANIDDIPIFASRTSDFRKRQNYRVER